jgi:hypothetical protein
MMSAIPKSARAGELQIANCTLQIEKRRGRKGGFLPFFCRFFAVQYAICNVQSAITPTSAYIRNALEPVCEAFGRH